MTGATPSSTILADGWHGVEGLPAPAAGSRSCSPGEDLDLAFVVLVSAREGDAQEGGFARRPFEAQGHADLRAGRSRRGRCCRG